MPPIRKRLIEIIARMADEPAKTMIELDQYIIERENDAVQTYILTGRSLDRSPEITPERMDGE